MITSALGPATIRLALSLTHVLAQGSHAHTTLASLLGRTMREVYALKDMSPGVHGTLAYRKHGNVYLPTCLLARRCCAPMLRQIFIFVLEPCYPILQSAVLFLS